MKGRISALDARMAIVERLLGSINTPAAQAWADQILTDALTFDSVEEE